MRTSVSTLFVVVVLATCINAQAQIGRKAGKLGQPSADGAGQGGFAPPVNNPPGFDADNGFAPQPGGAPWAGDQGVDQQEDWQAEAWEEEAPVNSSSTSSSTRISGRAIRGIITIIVLVCGGIAAVCRKLFGS